MEIHSLYLFRKSHPLKMFNKGKDCKNEVKVFSIPGILKTDGIQLCDHPYFLSAPKANTYQT